MKLLFAVLLVSANLSGFARIAGAQDCITNTWKGTIGTVPVMMEFEDIDEEDGVAGRYYYRTSLVDLFLVRDDTTPDRWKELDPKGKVTGYLTLSCGENALSGSWSSADGSRTLAVSADVQPGASYSSQRLDGLKPTVAGRESIGKFHYELISAQGLKTVKSLRLLGEGKAVADINGALLKEFTSKIDEAIDCNAWGRWRRGEDHDYTFEYELSMIDWNKAFVVIGETSSQYCGGIHPLYGAGATTYNLQTGKREDVSQWLVDPYGEDIPKDSPLGKIILKIYSAEDIESSGESKCNDSVEFSGHNAWPTSEGITFRPSASYAATACIQDITVPYNSMSPYLSPQGKTSVQAFQSR